MFINLSYGTVLVPWLFVYSGKIYWSLSVEEASESWPTHPFKRAITCSKIKHDVSIVIGVHCSALARW